MARELPESAREWIAWVSPSLLVLVGLVLIFIPAPPTSLIGILLVLVGAIFWLVDYFGDGQKLGARRREGQQDDLDVE